MASNPWRRAKPPGVSHQGEEPPARWRKERGSVESRRARWHGVGEMRLL
ncbi:unnamed protein product [Rhodiola kirilowii]